MAHHHQSASSFSDFTLSATHDSDVGDSEIEWPFGRVDAVDSDELRETAYELFFASCRSSPGFGGRNPLSFYPSSHHQPSAEGGSGAATPGSGITVVNSKIKRVLSLRTRRGSPPMRTMSSPAASAGGAAGAVSPGTGRLKQRPMTSAEIMRHQMGVTEQSDSRLRKTIMRTLVGQVIESVIQNPFFFNHFSLNFFFSSKGDLFQAGKRAETIILPLELLRQVKPSEFSDAQEYHQWQRRQLKILEAGLLQHPSVPLDNLNASALRLREVIRSGELKPIDTSKNSESLRVLCNAVVSLAWRNPNGSPAEACHWADGFPLNVHLYLSLLRSIFDLRDETVVLEEVDEMMELMKKTWVTVGISKMTHNVCFAWTMFEQYVKTGQIVPDLLGATLFVLGEIAADAKRDAEFLKVLSPAMSSMLAWAERKLHDYHTVFRGKCSVALMEKVLSLALTTAKILNDDRRISIDEDGNGEVINSAVFPVERYIKSSLKSAFTKVRHLIKQYPCNSKKKNIFLMDSWLESDPRERERECGQHGCGGRRRTERDSSASGQRDGELGGGGEGDVQPVA